MPRVSGRIASGPASPASPSPPLHRKEARTCDHAARRERRHAARRRRRPWRSRAPTRPPSTLESALPIPCPIGASAWLSARLRQAQRQRLQHVLQPLAVDDGAAERIRHRPPETVGEPLQILQLRAQRLRLRGRFSKSDGIQHSAGRMSTNLLPRPGEGAVRLAARRMRVQPVKSGDYDRPSGLRLDPDSAASSLQASTA